MEDCGNLVLGQDGMLKCNASRSILAASGADAQT